MPKILKMPKRNSSKREGNNLSELNRPTHLDILPEFEEDSLGLARIARWIDLADQALDVDQPRRKRA